MRQRICVAVLFALLACAGASWAQVLDRPVPTPAPPRTPKPVISIKGDQDNPNEIIESQALPPPGGPLAPKQPSPLPGRGAPQRIRPDGSSMDAILAALYESMSHGPEYEPNWNRMRALFLPDGRIIPPMSADEKAFKVLDVNGFREWVTKASAAARQKGEPTSFFEREIARRADCFGSLCQVFSTYEARRAPGDAAPFARGVNSIQLLHDNRRWWVASIIWDTEGPDNPIPASAVGVANAKTGISSQGLPKGASHE